VTGSAEVVTVRLPGVLREDAGGLGEVSVQVGDGCQVRDVLAELARRWPALGRRVLDDTGTLRRHVNVFVDGDDVRSGAGDRTPVGDGAVVHLLPSVAGG
jgi:sulfur-carrier protein